MSVETAGTEKTVNVQLEAAETQWEIAPGHMVSGYAFNGQIPGPTIEANVGDTLVVELTNALPEPTSIHWHGLRVPVDIDGTELVQQPIQPGESFEYRFVLPDAGTFWYHPHTNETVQLEKGVYGALVVRGHWALVRHLDRKLARYPQHMLTFKARYRCDAYQKICALPEAAAIRVWLEQIEPRLGQMKGPCKRT